MKRVNVLSSALYRLQQRFHLLFNLSIPLFSIRYTNVAYNLTVYAYRAVEYLIGTIAHLGNFTIDHRIRKSIHVSRSLPNIGMQNNRAIQSNHILTFMDHAIPPSCLDVALQLNSQRPIIKKTIQSAVDIRRQKNKSLALAKRNQIFHAQLRFHVSLPSITHQLSPYCP